MEGLLELQEGSVVLFPGTNSSCRWPMNLTPNFDLQGSVTGRKPLPVRPGMFLETVSKVTFNLGKIIFM